MAADQKMRDRILALVPQQKPFRFIEEILELSENHIVGTYRFRPTEYFYPGHFPDRPITPGVILIETMAQIGVVALGLYLAWLVERKEKPAADSPPLTLFTLADEVEFLRPVLPGERVFVRGEKVYFRNGAIKSKVEMLNERGQAVCTGFLAGKGFFSYEA